MQSVTERDFKGFYDNANRNMTQLLSNSSQ